jgi:hypothetical protein
MTGGTTYAFTKVQINASPEIPKPERNRDETLSSYLRLL